MPLDGYQLVALLMGVGALLLLAEALLPTHGVLGILGGVSLLCAVFAATRQNAWVGLTLVVALAAVTPLAWSLLVKFWPRTPMGRRIMLPPIEQPPQTLVVRVGQAGITVTELRPMGMCEFDGTRIESISEHGIVPAGASVKVVALSNNRPTVRVV